MNGLPMLPAIIIDVAGSTANIVFAFLATRYAYKLTRLKPGNFLWGYLFYVTLAISAFPVQLAISPGKCSTAPVKGMSGPISPLCPAASTPCS